MFPQYNMHPYLVSTESSTHNRVAKGLNFLEFLKITNQFYNLILYIWVNIIAKSISTLFMTLPVYITSAKETSLSVLRLPYVYIVAGLLNLTLSSWRATQYKVVEYLRLLQTSLGVKRKLFFNIFEQRF